jgi:hypothetical protein
MKLLTSQYQVSLTSDAKAAFYRRIDAVSKQLCTDFLKRMTSMSAMSFGGTPAAVPVATTREVERTIGAASGKLSTNQGYRAPLLHAQLVVREFTLQQLYRIMSHFWNQISLKSIATQAAQVLRQNPSAKAVDQLQLTHLLQKNTLAATKRRKKESGLTLLSAMQEILPEAKRITKATLVSFLKMKFPHVSLPPTSQQTRASLELVVSSLVQPQSQPSIAFHQQPPSRKRKAQTQPAIVTVE